MSNLVPYGQKRGTITVDVNNDGFADGKVHGAPSVAIIDSSQSQSVWTWIKIFPSLVRHQWFTMILALVFLSVMVPTGLHILAAVLRPDARFLEAKDGGAAGNFAPWVWGTNLVTAIKKPVSETAGKLQDAAIDNDGNAIAAPNTRTRTRANVE